MFKKITFLPSLIKKVFLLALSFSLLVGCKDGAKKMNGFVREFTPEPEEKEIPKTKTSTKQDLSSLIPPGYSIVKTKAGKEVIQADLDKDGQKDVVLLIEMKGDPSYDQPEEVLLMIYTADRHGELQLTAASENLGGESVSAGNEGKLLSVKNQVIVYHHQSMRHHMELKFRYETKSGDFMLIGKEYADYGGMEDGPGSVSINYLAGVKLTNNSKWDEESEDVVPLPQEKESFNQPLQSLSSINWDRMYNDL